MEYDREKLIKAKSVIEKIANGINPISGESIKEDSFMQDPRLIRCFFYQKFSKKTPSYLRWR